VGWRPAVVAGALPRDAALAGTIASRLDLPVALTAAVDPADEPLLVTEYNQGGEDWAKQTARLTRWRAGTTFALAQAPNTPDTADIAGRVGALDAELVRSAADAALAKPADAPDIIEAASLLGSTMAPWRRRYVDERTTY
jgi:hypothetical protein